MAREVFPKPKAFARSELEFVTSEERRDLGKDPRFPKYFGAKRSYVLNQCKLSPLCAGLGQRYTPLLGESGT